MREEVSSAEEGGEAEPNEIDVYEVGMYGVCMNAAVYVTQETYYRRLQVP